MLEIKNIKKSFKEKQVLHGINFKLNEGQIITILGANGAGKTTILNSILKMVRPDEGSIYYKGSDIYELKNKEYFKNISAVLESSSNVYDCLTGRQNIEYFAGVSKINLKKPENSGRIKYYSELFKLEKDLDYKVGGYSRGMQQKLAIIIALIVEPKVLLLDEPTLGLDIESKLAMIDFLKKIVKEKGISLILTTHQMEVVEKIGGKILLLKKGKVEEFASIYDLCKFEDRYLVGYLDNNIYREVEVAQDITEILNTYKNIRQLKKIEPDIEKIVMEKLNESI